MASLLGFGPLGALGWRNWEDEGGCGWEDGGGRKLDEDDAGMLAGAMMASPGSKSSGSSISGSESEASSMRA